MNKGTGGLCQTYRGTSRFAYIPRTLTVSSEPLRVIPNQGSNSVLYQRVVNCQSIPKDRSSPADISKLGCYLTIGKTN